MGDANCGRESCMRRVLDRSLELQKIIDNRRRVNDLLLRAYLARAKYLCNPRQIRVNEAPLMDVSVYNSSQVNSPLVALIRIKVVDEK